MGKFQTSLNGLLGAVVTGGTEDSRNLPGISAICNASFVYEEYLCMKSIERVHRVDVFVTLIGSVLCNEIPKYIHEHGRIQKIV